MDSDMMKQMQSIREEEEHDNIANSFSYDMASPIQKSGSFLSPSKTQRKARGSQGMKGSFIGGEEAAPNAPETEEQKAAREKKEMKDSFKILTKEESQFEMKTRGFDDFLSKTSRILERALDSEFDVVGDFFIEDDESLIKKSKKEKVTQQFVFQPNVQMKRAVNSIDWSPTVGELMLVSYSKSNDQRQDETDGLVNIFSLNLKNRPEITLTC
mmetsp:Transcript_2586/g.4338  ORF Transcript_2586/g.4338 Transcript_2586/m.4338 type:complete len:213 (+) Transcript_2586:321-959(+)